MSYEKFVAAGAEVINGYVFLNRTLMGRCVGNEFVTMPEGDAWLESDAAPVEAPAPAKKAAKKAAAVDPTADLLGGLDDLAS